MSMGRRQPHFAHLHWLKVDMSEPKKNEPTDGLPLDWSLSSVAAVNAPSPVAAPATPAPLASETVQRNPPQAAVSAPVETAPVSQTMDMNVLGAIGAWQRPPAREMTGMSAGNRVLAQLANRIPASVLEVPPMPTKPIEAPTQIEAMPSSTAANMPTQATPQVAPAALQRADVAPPSAVKPHNGLLSRAVFWQVTAGFAVLVAAVMGILALQKPVTFETAVAPIGVVNAPAPIYLAELGDGKLRVTPLAIGAVPATKDLQLWMFMLDQQTPISLGVLPATGGIFSLPQIPVEGARFVISLEPHGGTPPGKITGEVLYGGTLARR